MSRSGNHVDGKNDKKCENMTPHLAIKMLAWHFTATIQQLSSFLTL